MRTEIVGTIKHGEFKHFHPVLGMIILAAVAVGTGIAASVIFSLELERAVFAVCIVMMLAGTAIFIFDAIMSGTWIEYFFDAYGKKKIVYSGKYREKFGDLEDGTDSQEWRMSGYLPLCFRESIRR